MTNEQIKFSYYSPCWVRLRRMIENLRVKNLQFLNPLCISPSYSGRTRQVIPFSLRIEGIEKFRKAKHIHMDYNHTNKDW